MTRTAELFDGTRLEFPDDTKDEVIARVAKEQTLKLKEAEGTTAADVGGEIGRIGVKGVIGGVAGLPAMAADLAYHGVMSPINSVYRIGQAGAHLLGYGDQEKPFTPEDLNYPTMPASSAVSQAAEAAAGKVAPAPTSPEGRIGEALATGAIEAIAGSGLFRVAGKIFSSLPEAAAAFEALSAGGPLSKSNAAYSAAASGGGQAAQEEGVNPLIGTGLGLAAAATGHALGSAVRSAASGMADDVLRRTVPVREEAAAERLRRTATSSPDELVNKLTFGESPELVPGSKPTLYEVTGDKGIGGQERKAFTADTPLEPDTGGGKTFRTEMEARREAQNEARVGEVRDLGGQGDKTAIVDTFRKQREILDQSESFKENVAQAEADRTVGRAGTQATPEEVGAGLRGPMEESRQRVAEAGNKLYQALDAEGVTVGTGQLKAAVAQHFKDIPENPLSSLERRIAKVVSGYGGRLDFETLQQLRSRVAAEARNFTANDVTRRRFTLLKKAIDQAMDDGLQRAVTADGSLVTKVDDALTAAQREANRHWAEYKTAYGPEPVLKKGATESGFKMTEAAIPKASFVPGDTGGARIRAMRAAGATDDALAEAAAFSMQKAAIRDGAVDPTAFRRWVNNHRAALAELPLPVRQRFQSAADAAGTLEQVTTARQTAMRGFDESAVGKILNTPVADLEKTIKAYLETPSRAHELANAVSGNPAARDGLRRLTADYVLRQFTDASETLSKASLTKWLERNKAQMSAIFGQEGVQRLERLVKDVERSRRQMTVGKDPAGPGTAGDMATMMNSAGETVMSTLAHAVGGPAGSVVGGLLKGIVGNLKTAGMKDVDAIFARALLDPEFARKLLTRAPALKNERFRKGLGTAILRSSALGAAYGDT